MKRHENKKHSVPELTFHPIILNEPEEPIGMNLGEDGVNNEEPICMNVEENIEDPTDDNDEQEIPTIPMNEEIMNAVLQIVLELHSKPNFARSDVFTIQSLIMKLLEILLTIILSKTNNCQCQTKTTIEKIIKVFMGVLNSVKSDYGLIKVLMKLNLAKDLENKDYEFTISKELGVVFKDRCRYFGDIVNRGMIMPLRFQIKEFLNRQGRLAEMVENIKKLSIPSETISHILQGSSWAQIRSHFNENQIVIPIGLYTDGMQYNNALGTHTDSTDMLYYFFPALLDPFHRNNIHVAAIIRSKHIQFYGSGRCLSTLVRELFKLYFDGIDIKLEGQVTNVKIVLCQVIGDNSALNTVLQYLSNFSKANFYCRICKMSRIDAQKYCEELISQLRTQENYQRDLLQNDSSKTGIAENCVFNALPYLHCTLNYSLDLMHDFFEGIIQYDICQALLYFIRNKLITLEEINDRISNFRYGSEDIRYIPNILIKANLEANKLKMSAREAWQFLYLLPLLIGDKIPEGDEVWDMLRTLLKILEISLESSFDDLKIGLLAALIKRHHTIYKTYFGELKPKMHFITHLPSSIRAMGPPRKYMCFRMEYKHQFFKVYAHCINSRKNIAKTLAKKYMLHFAFLLLDNKPYLEIETGKPITPDFPELLSDDCLCYKKLNYRGTDYARGMFLPLYEMGRYSLYEILEVVVQFNEISIICRKVGTLYFQPHYESYSINRGVQENTEVERFPLSRFNSVPLYVYFSTNKTEFIRPKIFFQQI